ncbi:MAG: ABC transporter substrate-binding protein [Patescibacteria group bacterium]|nr:ABC transporter substrate-binding protein [Patescibacteria group bacterium]
MNATIKWIIGIIIVIAIIWIGFSLGDKQPAETGPIKIGLSAPLTGEGTSFGDGMRAGAQLAVSEINEAGGVDGRMVEVIYEDDTCTARGGSTVFNKLVNVDRVDAIAGPLCSAVGAAGLPIAQEAGVPTIEFGSAPALPAIGDYIFRTYPSDSFQGKFTAEYLTDELSKKKAAVLYVKNDWGQGLSDVFEASFTELGGEVVYNEGVAPETKDLKSFIAKIKLAEPDVIYLPAYPNIAIIGLRQMAEAGIDVPIWSGDAFDTDEIVKSGVADGAVYVRALTASPDDFKQRIKDETGIDSNLPTPLTYDAIHILAKVFGEVGTDKEAVRDALASLSYRDAVSLPLIEFDELGDLTTAEFEIMTIQNGEAVPYVQE